MQGGRKIKVAISDQYLAIARKRLKVGVYMLRGVWQALNSLDPCNIYRDGPGAQATQLTHVQLAIAILLVSYVNVRCGQADEQANRLTRKSYLRRSTKSAWVMTLRMRNATLSMLFFSQRGYVFASICRFVRLSVGRITQKLWTNYSDIF